MDLNYIILAHKSPLHISRLVNRLNHKRCYFYIHIDKNTPIEPFRKILKSQSNVFFLNEDLREPGTWGDLGIVKGTLNAMKNILKDGRRGYCILLSGQDYPLKPNNFIYNFFQRNYGCNYIDLFELPTPNWNEGGMNRINKYKINRSKNRGDFLILPTIFQKDFYSLNTAGKINYLRKVREMQTILKIFRKRKFPNYLRPYGGSQWMALTTVVVQEIIAFIEEHSDYLEYHQYTLLPDEIFFHSIVNHLHKTKSFKLAPSITYAHWNNNKKKSGPSTLERKDLEELKNIAKEKLFARKFDLDMDPYILDFIDQQLLKENQLLFN